jgi:ABC-2 type transport system ATP-binding protein
LPSQASLRRDRNGIPDRPPGRLRQLAARSIKQEDFLPAAAQSSGRVPVRRFISRAIHPRHVRVDIGAAKPFCHDAMPDSPPASICVRDLTKRYGTVHALGGITFDVTEGEIFGLLGPNGAGKTTTLECILGLRRPDSGTVTIGGIDALAHPERAKELVGAQIQASALQDYITPRQALALIASFYRAPARVDELLDRFSLRGKADATFESLSHGQKQRLLLALAFVNQPRLVILDEPTIGLDPHSRRELHEIISGLRASGHTVLLSTQNLEEAHRLCDRVAILDQGRIVATAPPDELIARAGGNSHLVITTNRPLDASAVEALPGVVAAWSRENGWLLGTTEVNRTIVSLVKSLEATGNSLVDLQIQQPSLEDAFLSLTGRPWSAPKEEREPDE